MFDLLESIGNCVLYHDYRSGSFRDWSGNGNDGVPSSAVSLGRDGADFSKQANLITVPYSAELDLGGGNAMTAVCLSPDNFINDVGGFPRFYEQTGGIECYFDFSGVSVAFFIGGVPVTLTGLSLAFNTSRCLAFDWTDGQTVNFYANGSFASSSIASLNKGSDTSDIIIGNRAAADRRFGRTMSALLFFNKALSATEHAELYGALAAMRWPTKTYFHSPGMVGFDPNDTGLVGAWDMRPVAGKVHDISGNGNDGTQSGRTIQTVLGSAMVFDSGLGVDCGIDASLNLTGAMTLSGWVQMPVLAGTVWCMRKDNYGVSADSSQKVSFYTRKADDTGADTYAVSDALDIGTWCHFAAVFDPVAQTKTVYTNGTPGTPISKTDGGVPTSPASTFWLGSNGVSPFPAPLKSVKVYNRALSATEIAAEYAKGAKALTSTNWGARETSAAVAGGNMTNTPFEVISGTHKIVTDTINGTPVKALECVTAGVVALPSSVFQSGDKGAARGTFEFWVYKALTVHLVQIGIIGNQASAVTSAGFDGYEYRLNATNEIQFIRRTNGGSATRGLTAGSPYVATGQWDKHTITVGNGGIFTFYYNGVLVDFTGGIGTNPLTDATYDESKYLVLDIDAGDKIALGAIDGSYAIKKYLGVV